MARIKKTPEAVQPTTSIGTGIARKLTGLFSFDLAVGGGLPLYSITELSGPNFSCKTTLCAYLCGAVAHPKATIALLDIETADQEYPETVARGAGWDGEMWPVPAVDKGKPYLHEDMMDILINRFDEDDGIMSIMFDSVGAFRAAAEFEGSVGEANMGKRAQVIGKFMGKMNHKLRARPAHMVCINHVHQKMGGMAMGTVTSGGKAMEYLPSVRADVWAKRGETYWTINGEVFKLRYRNRSLPYRKNFKAIVLPGIGVHRGLTAVEDCILLGLAERDKVIKLAGQSFGYFAKMVESYEDNDLFQPFHEALNEAIKLS